MRLTLLMELPKVLNILINEIWPLMALYNNGVDRLMSKTLEVRPFSNKYYNARLAW